MAVFFVVGAVLFGSLPTFEQMPNLSGASNCVAADFDTYVDFTNDSGDTYTVVINKRNISSHSCSFDGPVYGPSLVPDRIEGEQPVELCYDCENRRLPPAQRQIERPITINPGDVAQQSLRWKTKPASASAKCLPLEWIGEPLMLVVPSLLKPVCSEVDFSSFTLLPTEEAARIPDHVEAPALQLTSDKKQYFERENFSLHVARTQGAAEKPESCPKLYLRQRSPDGRTRLDEVRPLAFKGCKENAVGFQPGDWQSGFEVDSGANSRWEGSGEHTMQVFQLIGSPDDSQLLFLASNVLRVEIADPTLIARKWGRREKGIAADITLDKNTYRVGEDVPLHIAVEDFDASLPLYAWSPTWDPCLAVGIEVRDAGGHPIPPAERLPNRTICTGHGFGPVAVAKGKVIPIERSLGAEGWLPSRPGTYTVVVNWGTCSGPKPTADKAKPAELTPYAAARATATIHIVEK